MSAIGVKTQGELDKALKKLKPGDYIACIGGTPFDRLIVRGSAHVVAWESAHVEARESAHVVARESAHVEAWESAHVEAWGSAHVVARGSAHVEAWESAHVEATKFVAVHKQPSHRGKINGGVVIEVPDVSQMSPTEWCDYYGAKVTRGFVTLYKALDEDLSTPQARTRGIFYAIGTKAKAADWNAIKACGNGLHACASPVLARGYNPSATRYVQVKAKLADLVVIDDKVKVPALTVVCEVDIHGEPLVEAAAA